MKEIIFDLLSVGKPAKAFSLNPEVALCVCMCECVCVRGTITYKFKKKKMYSVCLITGKLLVLLNNFFRFRNNLLFYDLAYEYRSTGIPGNSRCTAAEGWGASDAQHRSHSSLWKLFEEEENVSEQDSH